MRPGFFLQTGIRGMEKEQALKAVSKILPSSIVLFKSDFSSPSDLQQLIRDLKHLYRIENGINEPLIAVDQEGGNVVRINWIDYNPSNLFLGRYDNINFTYYVGALTGQELSALGIRWNLAPVLDVLNPYNQVILERSFGDDILKIANHGAAYIKGLQSQGVVATAKHFPGHGGVIDDSHLVLPTDRRAHGAVLGDAFPFRYAIENGVKSVMLSHVLYTSLDSQYPASISPKIQALLRNDFGYGGIIITDSLDMKAITDNFDFKEIVRNTLFEEVDLIENANLVTSLELMDYVDVGKIQNLDSKKARINKLLGTDQQTRVKVNPDALRAVEIIGPVVRREVHFNPEEKIDVVFLEIKSESRVAEDSQAGNLENELLKSGLNLRLLFGADVIDDASLGRQVVFIGRNEHLKERISAINKVCEKRKCAYISTSVDRDIGLFSPGIGYVSAFSMKPRIIYGSILKLVGFI